MQLNRLNCIWLFSSIKLGIAIEICWHRCCVTLLSAVVSSQRSIHTQHNIRALTEWQQRLFCIMQKSPAGKFKKCEFSGFLPKKNQFSFPETRARDCRTKNVRNQVQALRNQSKSRARPADVIFHLCSYGATCICKRAWNSHCEPRAVCVSCGESCLRDRRPAIGPRRSRGTSDDSGVNQSRAGIASRQEFSLTRSSLSCLRSTQAEKIPPDEATGANIWPEDFNEWRLQNFSVDGQIATAGMKFTRKWELGRALFAPVKKNKNTAPNILLLIISCIFWIVDNNGFFVFTLLQ